MKPSTAGTNLWTPLVGAFALGLYSLACAGQDSIPATQDGTEQSREPLEEITVRGDRSFFAIRFQIREALNEEMLRIATENPEYLEALMRIETLKEQFTAMRQRRFGD